MKGNLPSASSRECSVSSRMRSQSCRRQADTASICSTSATPPVVTELPVKLDALLIQPQGQLVLAGQISSAAVHAQRARAELQRNVAGALEQALDPLEALLRPRRVPKGLEIERELETDARIVRFRPIQRRAQVVAFR